MKNIILFNLILCSIYCNAQITLIPDPNFEQKLIDLGIDSDGVVNGQVLTNDIDTITFLDVNSSNINDLTGIEDFNALEILEIPFNNIVQLDLSNNLLLETLVAFHNPLNNINLNNCSLLKYVWLGNFDPGMTNYTTFTAINLSTNLALEIFECRQCRHLETINFENNPNLAEIHITSIPEGAISNLTSVNLKNGNNSNLLTVVIGIKPNLTCLQVDNPQAANNNQPPYNNWVIQPAVTFSEDCFLSTPNFDKPEIFVYPNPTSGSIFIEASNFNFLTQYVLFNAEGKIVLNDTVNSKILNVNLSNLESGIYFFRIHLKDGNVITEKIIKN